MSAEQPGEWWAVISHAFESHVREERHFLNAYEQLCSEVLDPGTRFLIQLILDDERRHHTLFERMAASARGDADPSAGTPDPPRVASGEARRILELTERFLEAELEDRRHLRELRQKLKPARDDTVWHLVVGLMELDTAKHVKILEYLRERLRELNV